jgi:hypothetical protein
MRGGGCRHHPIVEHKHVVGIVPRRDLAPRFAR